MAPSGFVAFFGFVVEYLFLVEIRELGELLG